MSFRHLSALLNFEVSEEVAMTPYTSGYIEVFTDSSFDDSVPYLLFLSSFVTDRVG